MYSSYMKRAAGFFGLLSGLNKTYLDVCCKALGDPRLSRAEVAILLSLQGEPLCNTQRVFAGRRLLPGPQAPSHLPAAGRPAGLGPAGASLPFFCGADPGRHPPRGSGYHPQGHPEHPPEYPSAAANIGSSIPPYLRGKDIWSKWIKKPFFSSRPPCPRR